MRFFNHTLYPADRLAFERDVEAVCAGMTPEAFQAAWREGQAMSLDLIIAYALDKSNRYHPVLEHDPS